MHKELCGLVQRTEPSVYLKAGPNDFHPDSL
jgi:hypothetical protein